MSSDFAIDVTGVGKRFVKYEDTPMLVSRVLSLRNRTRRSSLWALRGATFQVLRGESLGIIGRNGSGKSTLLQMLAGVTAPTEGRVCVKGRVAPLISVGVGFHPELSGRENVYVNGAILGLSRQQLDDRLDDIVAFAEIGDFLDTPVKFYSSGMFVRLGFSVSAMAEPDVLLVDEVLAVGDLAFQLKCFDRMEQLRERGCTIVVVSHNLNAIRQLCDRALVVHAGELRYDGGTVDALSRYHELLGEPRELGDEMQVESGPTSIDMDFLDLTLLDGDGVPTHHLATGDLFTVAVTLDIRAPVESPVLALNVVSEAGVRVYGELWPLDDVETTQRVSVAIDGTARMPTGSYSLHLSFGTASGAAHATPPAPLLFFVAGRNSVKGLADLEGGLRLEQLDARVPGADGGTRPAGKLS